MHYFVGGVYAKKTLIPAGAELAQHAHSHDHMSILASGAVVLTVDGEASTWEAPACITVRAGARHAVRALTDAVWFCVWPSDADDTPGNVDARLLA